MIFLHWNDKKWHLNGVLVSQMMQDLTQHAVAALHSYPSLIYSRYVDGIYAFGETEHPDAFQQHQFISHSLL